MVKKIRIACLLIACLWAGTVHAQELNCMVQIDDSQVQTQERRVFREMETTFAEFLNNRRWTNDDFGYNEKINCNVQITLNPSDRVGFYSGTIIIQSARPVYGTSYTTSTFLFADRDFAFEYVESQPLDFSENNFNSNLTSVLAYYANIILGMDYDSFSALGGTPFFERARNITQIARQSGISGWDQHSGSNAGRNRASLIENLMNTQMLPMREMMYNYHRLALDTFAEEPEKSREIVLEGLKKLREVRNYNPNAVLLSSFMRNKETELTNMFSKGDIAIRRQALEVLSVLDPSGADKYARIIK